MGTSDIDGLLQSKATTQCKSGISPSLLLQGRLVGTIFHDLRLQLLRATQQDYGEAAKWIIQLMAKSGTSEVGGFTEAQLLELRKIEPKKKNSAQRNALASAVKLQRKIIKTLNESMEEFSQRRKSLWWSRWIPRKE